MSARRRRRDPIALALMSFLVLLLFFIIAPIVIVIINSFNSVPYSIFPPRGFSLQWYRNLLELRELHRAFVNSLVIAGGATVLALLCGIPASLVLVRSRLPLLGSVKAFFLSPIVAPKVVLGVALLILFLRMRIFATLGSIILAHAILTLPFVIAVISASLINVDRSLEEAGMDLGARPLQVFWLITLPQIRTGAVVATAFSFIISFDQLETTIFLVRPALHTLPIEMFIYMERWQDPTLAALSTVLIVLTALGLATFNLLLRGLDLARYLRREAGPADHQTLRSDLTT